MVCDELDEWIDKVFAAEPPVFGEDGEELESEFGPPLAPPELADARAALSKWMHPSHFEQVTKAYCRRCRSLEWFNSPHLKFLHDAYTLAEFAVGQRVDSARLATTSEQWPDGYVKIGSHVHNVEVTSTHGGRKLGEEYRRVDETPQFDPVENWIARGESIPKWLDDVISSKSRKRYSSRCWLVVYLNISEWGIRQKETLQVIADTKARYASSFDAITVLWKGKLY